MNLLILFIPAAICLLVAFVGLVCLIVAAWGLKKVKVAATRKLTKDAAPPKLTDTKERTIPARRTTWLLRCLGIVGLVALLAGLFSVWQTGFSIGRVGKSPTEWSDGHAPELETLIRKHCVLFMNEGKSVGMVVAVVGPTNATVMAFGRASLSPGTQMRDDTLFEIGSITKTFTAIALAREIEQGAVQLDQPIQELLPPGIELPEAARAVTLRHLTTHTSGFPRLPANISPVGGIKMLLFGSNPYAGYPKAAFAEGVRSVKLQSKPGTKSGYSNFGGCLLGWLLAHKAGTNYEAFVKRDVCQPLGMHDTTITLDARQAARFAQGYRALRRVGPVLLGLRAKPWLLPNHLAGAGALRSTGMDMLKYLEANMRPKGQPLEKALSESHRELFREDDQTATAMNWIRSANATLKQVVIWHNGGTGGFCSFLGFTEDGRAGLAILSNTSESVDLLGIVLLQDLARQSIRTGASDRLSVEAVFAKPATNE